MIIRSKSIRAAGGRVAGDDQAKRGPASSRPHSICRSALARHQSRQLSAGREASQPGSAVQSVSLRPVAQIEASLALLTSAEESDIAGIFPQSVVFDTRRLHAVVDSLTSFPGMRVVDDCPWKRVLEIW